MTQQKSKNQNESPPPRHETFLACRELNKTLTESAKVID